MKVAEFITNYREAFGEAPELPIVFWYSDAAISEVEKINGCFFKAMKQVRDGRVVSLTVDTIGCFGGKLYTGFAGVSPHIPTFVSLKERYKKTPEMVLDFIESLKIHRTGKRFLHFARVDKVDSFDGKEACFSWPRPMCFRDWSHGPVSTPTPPTRWCPCSVRGAAPSWRRWCAKTGTGATVPLSDSLTPLSALTLRRIC